METINQIEDFAMFAKDQLDASQDRTIEDLFEQWRQHAFRDTDSLAVRASIRDLENGERGEPLDDFLAEFDAERNASESE